MGQARQARLLFKQRTFKLSLDDRMTGRAAAAALSAPFQPPSGSYQLPQFARFICTSSSSTASLHHLIIIIGDCSEYTPSSLRH